MLIILWLLRDSCMHADSVIIRAEKYGSALAYTAGADCPAAG